MRRARPRPLPSLRGAIAVLGVLLLAPSLGCGSRLTPAPDATETPGVGLGAADRDMDVVVEARVDAWVGRPRTLGDDVTPMLVRIENDSDHALRVRFDDFALVDGAGQRYAALPPFRIDGTAPTPVRDFTPSLLGFRVAPYMHSHLPHATVYDGFRFDPDYYDALEPTLGALQLPTPDMLAHALPEGVVDPEGRVSGFLYFEHVEGDAPKRQPVEFRYTLVDAETGQPFGRVAIPFRLTSEGPL